MSAPEFEPSSEVEAHLMLEAAIIIHNRLVAELDRLPWWRFGLRRGLALSLMVPGGACHEWGAAAERLDSDPEASP